MIVCDKTEIEKIIEIEKNKSSEYQGFVYIIGYDDCVKIGCTKRPYKRVKELNHMIEKYGSRKLRKIFISDEHTNYYDNEKKLHIFFCEKRIAGTELFDVSFENAVLVAKNKINIKDDTDKLREESKKTFENLKNFFDSSLNFEEERKKQEIYGFFSKMNIDEIEKAIYLLTEYSKARNDLKTFLEEFS